MSAGLVLTLAVACLASPFAALAAEPPAIVTLLEGDASLIRGTARYALAEGVRVQQGDIVEVGAKALTQVEFADGIILSLGPDARVLSLGAPARGGKGAADFYLLRGWVKVTAPKGAAPLRFTTPSGGLTGPEGTAVMHIDGTDMAVFAESGELSITEWSGIGAGPALRVRSGEFYTRKADQKGVIARRAAPAFVSAMPHSYLDNLPKRADRYKTREVAPRRIGEISYADAEAWLKLPLEMRRPFVKQWRPRIADPDFRHGLVANLRSHPEWDPILFPEKYKPKTDDKAKPATEAPTAKTDDKAKATTEAATATTDGTAKPEAAAARFDDKPKTEGDTVTGGTPARSAAPQ